MLEQVTIETALAAWTDALTAPPTPRHRVLVAQEQDNVVGFTALAPADDLQARRARPAVDRRRRPDPRRAAVGTARARLAAHGRCGRPRPRGRHDPRVSWIPEADTVSREFLIGAGWATDGLVRALDTGAGELREIRLHVAL